MPMPKYLYHATPRLNAESIARNGLEPRSVGGESAAYLCMSGKESGAVTLKNQASDILFRVDSANLNAEAWSERGAGKSEWRSTDGIPPVHLEYRRNLGNASQKTWRKASVYPLGV